MKDNKFLIITLAILSLGIIITYGIIKLNNRNFNNIKISKSNYIVYTESTNQVNGHVIDKPFINIKGDMIKQVNDNIEEYINSFNKEKTNIIYEYNINGRVLSLILKVEDYTNDYEIVPYFRAYNINLDTLELLSNETMYELYEIDDIYVSNTIENKLNELYNDLAKEGFFAKEECSFSCFLNNRDIKSYTKDIELFVRDGSLIAFKPYIFESFYSEEDFFKKEDREFLLVKAI